ncbi:hypothetical protein CYMTET_6665 [Cymbomonas tetramitiformis]|uniref:Uncharacterized protein n=1 Tax=Cymbomonas tetramitiformis TaxID=36881 RepID=A0AAE0GX00_9CHLO|nr:hypothetical protein CYMTET_6665 [Cymbomonas tetramitiformis]
MNDSYNSGNLKKNFMKFRHMGKNTTTVEDWRRLIVNVEEDSAFMKRLEGMGEDIMETLQTTVRNKMEMRSGHMSRTVLLTSSGAQKQPNHYDAGAYGTLVALSDGYPIKIYPGSHLIPREQLDDAKLESLTLFMSAKSVLVFHGNLLHAATAFDYTHVVKVVAMLNHFTSRNSDRMRRTRRLWLLLNLNKIEL